MNTHTAHQVDEHQVDELDQLRQRITTRVVGHDRTTRAAARLVCDSILIHKVRRYVAPDGWIDWTTLACDLITGVAWSSGEQRLARLACSLSDKLVYLDDEDINARCPDGAGVGASTLNAWSLATCLSGLDDTNRGAVLAAVHYAATGKPLNPATTPDGASGGESR